jgi:hypothetical protein
MALRESRTRDAGALAAGEQRDHLPFVTRRPSTLSATSRSVAAAVAIVDPPADAPERPLGGRGASAAASHMSNGYHTPPMGETALPLLDRSGAPPSSRSQALDYAGGDVEGRRLTENHSR